MWVVTIQEEAISVFVYGKHLFANLRFVFIAETLSLSFPICGFTGEDKQTLKKSVT